MRGDRFHGRFETQGRQCQAPDCFEAGEFRAPGSRASSFDGPGQYRWFCLDHVREFNAGYDWFEGMSADEILSAQSPVAGWGSTARVFRADAVGDAMPRWADFEDPLDAINARAAGIKSRAQTGAQMAMDGRFTADEAQALQVLGLSVELDRQKLRRRYSELVRRYHPDRNGGDRSHETRLGRVVDAYQLLRKSRALK
ncbi:DnaJ domain-containing protein [Altererythrobacter confluentis]|uniref:DnaJ domain-containing protein n=1 Tax=Allopontixanthobacter confluentis TaxID=1849021 RepID=A0A6L7GG95_9SPHN|nr:J domain-containing protein [Allopontixanthobacter confluentis]MXP13691.1 DnaJ domain-containing protein [Allopontixanthobacter confluentis]